MPLTHLKELYDEVLPHLPGITLPFAMHHIRLAAMEFCSKTRAWNFISDPLNIVAGDPLILTESNVNSAEPVAVLQVWYKDAPLGPLDEHGQDGLRTAQADTPYRWSGLPNAVGINLWPTPNASEAGVVKMRIALRPKRTADYIDADIYNQWYPTLADGAKARMFLVPKKPYTDINMARISRAEFLRGVADARWKKAMGYTPAVSAAVPPPFGV